VSTAEGFEEAAAAGCLAAPHEANGNATMAAKANSGGTVRRLEKNPGMAPF
jgi:hypothetical protein